MAVIRRTPRGLAPTDRQTTRVGDVEVPGNQLASEGTAALEPMVTRPIDERPEETVSNPASDASNLNPAKSISLPLPVVGRFTYRREGTISEDGEQIKSFSSEGLIYQIAAGSSDGDLTTRVINFDDDPVDRISLIRQTDVGIVLERQSYRHEGFRDGSYELMPPSLIVPRSLNVGLEWTDS